MNLQLSVLLLVISTLCQAQRTDTTITKIGDQQLMHVIEYNGDVKQNESWETKEKSQYTKEELFMRGIKSSAAHDHDDHDHHHHGEEEHKHLMTKDSIKEYHPNGLLKYEIIKKEKQTIRRWYQYDAHWDLKKVDQMVGTEISYYFGKNQEIVMNLDRIDLEGKLDETLTATLLITNKSKENIELQLDANAAGISWNPKIINIDPQETAEVAIEFNNNEYQLISAIDVSSNKQETYHLPIRIKRHDLGENDFYKDLEIAKKQPLIVAKDTIVLKLTSNEKLLLAHRGKKVVHKLPISKKVNEIDLKDLKKGKYLLKVVDLGTNKSRYSLIKKK